MSILARKRHRSEIQEDLALPRGLTVIDRTVPLQKYPFLSAAQSSEYYTRYIVTNFVYDSSLGNIPTTLV